MSIRSVRICEPGTPISVLGMGHVGLPTALGLAEFGWQVMGADGDANKLELIQVGEAPFYKPGLSELPAKHLRRGKR